MPFSSLAFIAILPRIYEMISEPIFLFITNTIIFLRQIGYFVLEEVHLHEPIILIEIARCIIKSFKYIRHLKKAKNERI
jgi:hypothetical protein